MTNSEREHILAVLRQELEQISEDCVREGWPSNGSNYELRADEVYKWYEESYPDLWEY